jgi:hypothetical protein
MPADTCEIIVTFPVPVELSREEESALDALLRTVCKRYEAANPGRVMWAAGWGGLCTSMPITAEDERNGVPLAFDMSVLHVEVAERADYRWPCAKCGMEQGDHRDHILNPPAGDCEFEAAPPPPSQPKEGER